MKNNSQIAVAQFISEAKQIEGAEGAVFKLSDEFGNCIILSGKIFGKDTNDKINELGKKYGLLVLAQGLNISYERPQK